MTTPKILGLACLMLVLYWVGCANQVMPTGGEADKTAPQIEKTYPENLSLQFDGDELYFHFNEFIKKPTYGKEIFISPVLESRPKIKLTNGYKRVKIQLEEELKPNTTYVITLNDIADHYGGNRLNPSYLFAFSTGEVIDSMEISGIVKASSTSDKVTGMTLLLFEEDSVENDDFREKRPSYIAKTGLDGRFEFKYLGKRRFRLYGVEDGDQSYSYNNPTEKIALAENPLIFFPDSVQKQEITLFSSLPDEVPPFVKSCEPLSDTTLLCSFSERPLESKLQFILTDSAQSISDTVKAYSYLDNPERQFLLYTPQKRDMYSQVQLIQLVDSLGNRGDTLVKIRSSIKRLKDSIFVKKPVFRREKKMWELITPFILEDADSVLSVWDSSKQDIPIRLAYDGFRVWIAPMKPDPTQTYEIRLDAARLGLADSVYVEKLNWPDPKQHGTLAGKIERSDNYQGKFVVQLMKPGLGEPIQSFGDTFSFQYLPAGKYSLQVVLDDDGNGCWTPGSIKPYRLPEKIFVHATQIDVRANWDIEEEIVRPFQEKKGAVFFGGEDGGAKIEGKGGGKSPGKGN